MILIFTEKIDIHADSVIQHFLNENVEFLRINTDAILVDYDINLLFIDDKFEFDINLTKKGLCLKDKVVNSIWDRRPEKPSEYNGVDIKEIKEHCLNEAMTFQKFFRNFYFGNFFIGSPIFDRLASSKMYQMRIVSTLNMKYPRTLFSNRKEEILQFAKKFNKIIIKPIQGDGIIYNDEIYPLYSILLDFDKLHNLPEKSFESSINYFQEYIPKLFELRVTAVCGEIFACKIDSQLQDEETGKIDWRQGYDYGLKHSIFDLPNNIKDFCSRYLKSMNLNFGCFDFIFTPEGEYVFLECNPNGQWLWIEEETGMPISKAIADALVRGSW